MLDQKLFFWWLCCFASLTMERALMQKAGWVKRIHRMSTMGLDLQAGLELMEMPKHLQDPGVFWLNLKEVYRSFSIQTFFF